MLHLMPKNLNNRSLAALCALISLIPVLNYTLAVPNEMVLTLSAWVVSNMMITAFLLLRGSAHTVHKNI